MLDAKTYDVSVGKIDGQVEQGGSMLICKQCEKLRKNPDYGTEYFCKGCVLRSFADSRVRRSSYKTDSSMKHQPLVNNGSYCSQVFIQTVD